ncbi:MAG TPA: bifunctional phosphoribosylaminoimidazolecarboxamide formyltransferase/IMP cyclohydrolase [Longimicrobiales bacterium]|nr:bifunctional phosphoribosylaminoimidazolecarboxamide formyltransferase/IMP cyclohydrolase [Longimicrobiales bacterium]
MPRAILSVSDKTGLVELARGLAERGWELVSTGGTARALRAAGLTVVDVKEVTGHPEMMDGRVKTLHPAVHAGILARAGNPADDAALGEHGYAHVDLVAVNLYPFRETVARGATLDEAMEKVDIGGPTMIRAAAKNHARVTVVVDPADYGRVLAAVDAGGPDAGLRRDLARKVFAHTADYDAAVAAYLGGGGGAPGDAAAAGEERGAEEFPDRLALHLVKVQPLRYGENPDQPAAFYAETDAPDGSLPLLRQLQGKELSFNNLIDVDAAIMGASAWPPEEGAACCIIKHTTPCGLALGGDAEDAYRRALACDPVSAFGGIVALNAPLTAAAAAAMADHFLEVIVAPGFDAGALEVLERKKNLRLIAVPVEPAPPGERDYKRVRGGLLVQARMSMRFPEDAWKVVTRREPTADEWADLRFAWRAAAVVKSNAIVLVRDRRTIGIGAGQMSRVDSSRIAVLKAQDQGADLRGAVVASDAFFPFRDGVDAAAGAGARAIIQPGGSVRDAEVIGAADEHGVAMVFTGRRTFRH